MFSEGGIKGRFGIKTDLIEYFLDVEIFLGGVAEDVHGFADAIFVDEIEEVFSDMVVDKEGEIAYGYFCLGCQLLDGDG